MGLFGWFSKKTPAPASKPAAKPIAKVAVERVPEPAAAPPEPEPERGFGGPVAAGLTRYLQTRAHDMPTAGDKQYLSMLLRAVRNDGVQIPAMPADIMEIQRLLSSPDTEIADLAKAVQRDPAIAAKFVSVANSPLYRGIREVASVREAIVRIGLNHSGMIMLAITSSSKLFKVPGYEAEAKWLHAHSLGTAITAQFLARQVKENEQDAFMAGLLHDLGRVFMLSLVQDVFRATKGEASPSPEVVHELGDHLHAGFSALTAELWSYKPDVVSALQHHEIPPEGGAQLIAMVPAEHAGLTKVLAAANLIDCSGDRTPESVRELLTSLEINDIDETVASCREISDLFLNDLGIRRVANPF